MRQMDIIFKEAKFKFVPTKEVTVLNAPKIQVPNVLAVKLDIILVETIVIVVLHQCQAVSPAKAPINV